MRVTEKLNEGLRREIEVVLSADQLARELTSKIEQSKSGAQIKGFRPGKVPISYLRKTYSKSFMAEIINDHISALPSKILKDRDEKSALRPEISIEEDASIVERILNGEEDAKIVMSYEVLPQITIKDFSKLEVRRELAEISQVDKDNQLKELLVSSREFKESESISAVGDRLTIDYLGKLEGVPFENGKDNDVQIILGDNKFIPGFEEQLLELRSGDKRVLNITFPVEYGVASLAGKPATFDVLVKKVESPEELKVDDDSAKKIGAESLDHLKSFVNEQLVNKYGAVTRQKIKRQILDYLDSEYDILLPSALVDMEINSIAEQVKSAGDAAGQQLPAPEEYDALARRRVKLGLILGRIGEDAAITVSKDELQRALFQQLQHFPGQEKQMLDLFQSNPAFAESLQAPIFEDKVVDHILAKVNIQDLAVSIDDLMRDDDEVLAKPKKKSSSKRSKPKASDVESE